MQGILVDTVDFAFGTNSSVNLKDAIKNLGEPAGNKKSQRVERLLQKLKEEEKKA